MSDVYHVRIDGVKDRLRVYDWGNVQIHEQLREDSVERTQIFINAGDATFPPDAITQRFAEQLADEYGVDMSNHDIKVVDIDSDEVSVL